MNRETPADRRQGITLGDTVQVNTGEAPKRAAKPEGKTFGIHLFSPI